MKTSFTSEAAIPAFEIAPLIAAAPNCGAGTVDNEPPKLPIGVRTADIMYTSLLILFDLSARKISNLLMNFCQIIDEWRGIPIFKDDYLCSRIKQLNT